MKINLNQEIFGICPVCGHILVPKTATTNKGVETFFFCSKCSYAQKINTIERTATGVKLMNPIYRLKTFRLTLRKRTKKNEQGKVISREYVLSYNGKQIRKFNTEKEGLKAMQEWLEKRTITNYNIKKVDSTYYVDIEKQIEKYNIQTGKFEYDGIPTKDLKRKLKEVELW